MRTDRARVAGGRDGEMMPKGPKLLPTLLALAATVLGAPAAAKDRDRTPPPPVQAPPPPSPAAAWLAGPEIQTRLETNTQPELYGHYAARDYKPVWLGADGSLHPAAQALVELVETAELDGIDTRTLNAAQLTAAVR